MSAYLIIADGDFQSEKQITNTAKNKTIIALDGAYHKLIELGIKPEIILGDFDSVEAGIIQSPPTDLKVLHTPDQNHTDLVKAIRYCKQQGANTIDIMCATGGKMDLHEANMRALRSEYKKDRLFTIHTDLQSIRFIKDETISFKGKAGDEVGVLAYPKGIANSKGLKYELHNFPLEFAFSESVCNAMTQEKVTVCVEGEALVVMPLQG